MLRATSVNRLGIFVGGLLLLASSAHADWRETAKLTVSDARANDKLGYSVALDGDTLVAGARDRSEVGFASGAAYVYEREPDGSWTQAKVLPGDLGSGDSYGQIVGLGGDTLAVGAPSDDPGGSLYIFYRDPLDAFRWNEIAKLKDPEGDQDNFSLSLQLDRGGQRLAVGDPYDGEALPLAGAVHIFERNAGGPDAWGWVAKITAPDAAISDFFSAGAIEGDVLVAGATRHNSFGFSDAGAAYVFERSDKGNWKATAQLFASDPAAGDNFGAPLALSGNILAVAAPTKDSDVGVETGVVYVFERGPNGAWTQAARLTAPDVESQDEIRQRSRLQRYNTGGWHGSRQ